MIVRALDNNGDWTFGSGKGNYLSGVAAIGQSIQTRISTFLGECFFSLNSGIDWYNLLGSKNQYGINLALGATILNTEGVTSVLQLSFTVDSATRTFAVVYQVMTVAGLVTGTLNQTTITNYLLTESGDPLITEGGENIVI